MTEIDVMSVELDPVPAEVSTARRFVRTSLAGLPGGVASDAQLVASELVTNAIEHGVGGPVTIAIHRGSDAVTVTVESVGPAPDVGGVDGWRMPDADEITGRGLGIVRAVADEVAVHRSPGRLVITASLTL